MKFLWCYDIILYTDVLQVKIRILKTQVIRSWVPENVETELQIVETSSTLYCKNMNFLILRLHSIFENEKKKIYFEGKAFEVKKMNQEKFICRKKV